ncbi:hypothetical protein TNCV_4537191 [Trichonephila clavipes]|nr:hypothetical protein TNCV_4537191 [Trichonephila clavipes]
MKERRFSERTLDAEVDDPGLRKERRERWPSRDQPPVVHTLDVAGADEMRTRYDAIEGRRIHGPDDGKQRRHLHGLRRFRDDNTSRVNDELCIVYSM